MIRLKDSDSKSNSLSGRQKIVLVVIVLLFLGAAMIFTSPAISGYALLVSVTVLVRAL